MMSSDGPLSTDFESGHGLWFWSQILILERQARRLATPRRLHRGLITTCAALYADWYVAMRMIEMVEVFIYL